VATFQNSQPNWQGKIPKTRNTNNKTLGAISAEGKSAGTLQLPEQNRAQICINHRCCQGAADTHGGLWAILTQLDKEGNFYAISFAL